MFKSLSLFNRKKSTRPLKDFYSEWINTLKNTLLPSLHQSISDRSPTSNLISTQVHMIHSHFQSYYETLDSAAEYDVAQLLFPTWRNSMEKPFLWIGDIHPYLFMNLLRSFIDAAVDSDSPAQYDAVCNWYVETAPSEKLMIRLDQIECGLRLMVPSLSARARNAQAALIDRIGREWGQDCGGIGEAMEAQLEELVSVFKDANRLRRSVLAEIMGTTSIYQAALFLQSLSQFLVGFRDRKLLAQFKASKTVYHS